MLHKVAKHFAGEFLLPEYEFEFEFITKLLFRREICDLTFVKTQDYVSFLVHKASAQNRAP